MGNVQATERSRQSALIAFNQARHLRNSEGGPISGPPPSGAILAYIAGWIDAAALIQKCTPLELNEFIKLDPDMYIRWMRGHPQKFRCWPGTTRCINNMNHLPKCPYEGRVQPLPTALLPDQARLRECSRAASAEGYHMPADFAKAWKVAWEAANGEDEGPSDRRTGDGRHVTFDPFVDVVIRVHLQ